MEYTWKILGLNTDNEMIGDEYYPVVKSVDWVKNCIDESENMGTYIGHTVLPDITEDTAFVNFSLIGLGMVVGWIESSTTDSERDIINEALAIQCYNQRITKQEPPWM